MSRHIDIPGLDLGDLFGALDRVTEEGIEFVTQKLFSLVIARVPVLLWLADVIPEEAWLLMASAVSGALNAPTTAFGGNTVVIGAWNNGLSTLVGAARAMGTTKNPAALRDAFKKGVSEGDVVGGVANKYPVVDDLVHDTPVVAGTDVPMICRRVRRERDKRKAEAAKVAMPPPRRGVAAPPPVAPAFTFEADAWVTLVDTVQYKMGWCPDCAMTYREAKPAAPPKPKSFVESLTEPERAIFLALLMAVKKAKGANSPDWRLVERAKTRESFDKDLMRSFLKKEAGKPMTKARIQAFLDIVDVDVDLSLVDYGKIVLTAFVGWVTGRHEIPRQVKIWGGIVASVIGLVALIYLCVVGCGGYLFFVNGWYHGRFFGWVIGMAMLALSTIPPYVLLKRQRGLWLNIGANILFWGSLGIWIVCYGGGIQQRALLVAMAMATTFIMVALTGLGELTALRRRTLLSTYLVSALLLFIGSGVFFGKVESQFRPLEVRWATVDEKKVKKKVKVVLTPNPYDLPEAHYLSVIFGKAAVDFQLIEIEKTGRLYSNEPLDILVPGVHARVREDGFGRYVYDWEPDKASQALALMESQGVIPDSGNLTMPDGQGVHKDSMTLAGGVVAKILGEKEEGVGATASTSAQHMWGHTHAFWVGIIVVSLVVAVLGVVAMAVMGSQDESHSGVARGFRAAGSVLAILAVLGGLFFATCVAVPLGVDRLFRIGEDDKVEESVAPAQSPPPSAPPPAPPHSGEKRRAVKAVAAEEPAVEPAAEGKEIKTPRRYSRETCLKLPHLGLRAKCLDMAKK